MTFSKTPNETQKLILSALLEKYNNSKTFKGSNKVRQSFCIRPRDVFPEYDDDFAYAVKISDFESDVTELENERLVKVERRGRVVERIYAVLEKIPLYHELIGTMDRYSELKSFENLLKSYMGRNTVLDTICAAQLERINSFKLPNIAKNEEKLERLLKCLDFILRNNEEILERELSIELFGDSKLFEKELKSKVCSLLESYCELDEFAENNSSIKNERILSRYMVVKNPTYFYFKGNGCIEFEDGTAIELSYQRPVAMRSDSVADISSITISCETVMTIENLTSFNRIRSNEIFCLFLSGYNNSCKTEFLKKIYGDNPRKEWLHFGDIDPDGFLILHNLRIKTGIDFKSYLMSPKELVLYKKYCKILEPNDIVKAQNMVNLRCFADVAQFMLDNNCKLEQEIISWKNKQP